MKDLVEVSIEITRKQRDWLDDLASDLRGDRSDAVQVCIDPHIEAAEKSPENPTRHMITEQFKLYVANHGNDRLDDAKKLLEELGIVLAIAYKEDEVRSLCIDLQNARNPGSIVRGKGKT